MSRLFERLSSILNSNEQFEMDDSFHFEVMHVRNPGRGSGRLRLGTKHIQQMLKSKKSVIAISNDDELCCARALVTAKAYRDKDNCYNDIRKGRPVQGKLALELHALTGVSEGPFDRNDVFHCVRLSRTKPQFLVLLPRRGFDFLRQHLSCPEGMLSKTVEKQRGNDRTRILVGCDNGYQFKPNFVVHVIDKEGCEPFVDYWFTIMDGCVFC